MNYRTHRNLTVWVTKVTVWKRWVLGWVAGALLLAVAFRAAAFLPLSAPAPAAMLRKGVDDCFRVASDMFV